MMTDESVIEWAMGWVRDNTPEDPTFRERFAAGLRSELASREAGALAAGDELHRLRAQLADVTERNSRLLALLGDARQGLKP